MIIIQYQERGRQIAILIPGKSMPLCFAVLSPNVCVSNCDIVTLHFSQLILYCQKNLKMQIDNISFFDAPEFKALIFLIDYYFKKVKVSYKKRVYISRSFKTTLGHFDFLYAAKLSLSALIHTICCYPHFIKRSRPSKF